MVQLVGKSQGVTLSVKSLVQEVQEEACVTVMYNPLNLNMTRVLILINLNLDISGLLTHQ